MSGRNTLYYIYFIKCNQFIKIGISPDPEQRIRQLQTGCPYKLSLVATVLVEPSESDDIISGENSLKMAAKRRAETTEAELHDYFSKYKIRGEWFKISPPIKQWIQQNAAVIYLQEFDSQASQMEIAL